MTGNHRVVAYESGVALVERLADFVAASLADGVPVITISRPTFLQAVETRLLDLGADPARARHDGALLTLDADEMLGRFMVEGRPHPERFAEVIASLVPAGGGPVSAFGEMVSLLWERGEVAAALELEELWNTAVAQHTIRLLCAYPADLLARADLIDVARVCDLHDHVDLVGGHPSAGEISSVAGAAVSSVHLPVPTSVASVRHFVSAALTSWGLDGMVGDVELITSELATNAITHGSSPFQTSLVRTQGVVRVSVEDGSSVWPERHDALPGDLDGRGMAIVATLSRRSGCDSTPTGKVAWAELSV